eukprot:tig00020563_g11312.t1
MRVVPSAPTSTLPAVHVDPGSPGIPPFRFEGARGWAESEQASEVIDLQPDQPMSRATPESASRKLKRWPWRSRARLALRFADAEEEAAFLEQYFRDARPRFQIAMLVASVASAYWSATSPDATNLAIRLFTLATTLGFLLFACAPASRRARPVPFYAAVLSAIGVHFGMFFARRALFISDSEVVYDFIICYLLLAVLLYLHVPMRVAAPLLPPLLALSAASDVVGALRAGRRLDLLAAASVQTFVAALSLLLLVAGLAYEMDVRHRFALSRAAERGRREAVERHQRSSGLLRNLLPDPVIEAIRAGDWSRVNRVQGDAAVVFVAAEAAAAALAPREALAAAGRLAGVLEAAAAAHGVLKIKSIGLTFMARPPRPPRPAPPAPPARPPARAPGVVGVGFDDGVEAEAEAEAGAAGSVSGAASEAEEGGTAEGRHAARAAAFALDAVESAGRAGFSCARAGLFSGPLVSGVIGCRLAFDVFGDACNLAQRMCAHGEDGRVHLPASARDAMTAAGAAGPFRFTEPAATALKGRGEWSTCFASRAPSSAGGAGGGASAGGSLGLDLAIAVVQRAASSVAGGGGGSSSSSKSARTARVRLNEDGARGQEDPAGAHSLRSRHRPGAGSETERERRRSHSSRSRSRRGTAEAAYLPSSALVARLSAGYSLRRGAAVLPSGADEEEDEEDAGDGDAGEAGGPFAPAGYSARGPHAAWAAPADAPGPAPPSREEAVGGAGGDAEKGAGGGFKGGAGVPRSSSSARLVGIARRISVSMDPAAEAIAVHAAAGAWAEGAEPLARRSSAGGASDVASDVADTEAEAAAEAAAGRARRRWRLSFPEASLEASFWAAARRSHPAALRALFAVLVLHSLLMPALVYIANDLSDGGARLGGRYAVRSAALLPLAAVLFWPRLARGRRAALALHLAAAAAALPPALAYCLLHRGPLASPLSWAALTMTDADACFATIFVCTLGQLPLGHKLPWSALPLAASVVPAAAPGAPADRKAVPLWVGVVALAMAGVAFLREREARRGFLLRAAARRAARAAAEAGAEADALLDLCLPKAALGLLPAGGAMEFERVCVLQSDIVGFSGLTPRAHAPRLVEALNALFAACDEIAERYGVQTLRTVGDAWVGAVGLERPAGPREVANLLRAAHEMRAVYARTRLLARRPAAGLSPRPSFEIDGVGETPRGSRGWAYETLTARFGVGWAGGGAVVGARRWTWELLGPAVDQAAAMERRSLPGRCLARPTPPRPALLPPRPRLSPRVAQVAPAAAALVEGEFEFEAGPEGARLLAGPRQAPTGPEPPRGAGPAGRPAGELPQLAPVGP